MPVRQDEQYLKQLSKMQRPIPGSSLTNDPDNPMPFEGPPEFTSRKDATEEIFSNMTKENVYVPLMETIANGTPVMELTQLFLFEGFRQGKWNPDLFLMLIEPTAYMMMALAERAGVDYIVDREPDEEEVENENLSELGKKVQSIKKKIGNKPAGQEVLPKEIEEKIEEMPEPELMKKPEPVAEEETDGLMVRGNGGY